MIVRTSGSGGRVVRGGNNLKKLKEPQIAKLGKKIFFQAVNYLKLRRSFILCLVEKDRQQFNFEFFVDSIKVEFR